MSRIHFIILTVLCSASLSNGLTCIKCTEEVKAKVCTSPNDLGCKFGVGKDLCNCCLVCLRGENESCGGLWNANGHCADGLKCSCTDGEISGTCVPGVGLPFIPYEYTICFRNTK